MQLKNYKLVVIKVYLGATVVSARGYSGISKYFKNTFTKHHVLALYSQRLMAELGHKYFNHI